MKIFVSAGETSGDIYAAHLVSEIKKLDPLIQFLGVGSENLLAQGVDIRDDISSKGTIGLIETLPNIAKIYSVFQKTKETLLKETPDAMILVDSQGFNVPLAEFSKKLGIKTFYFIPPQEWLWGKEKNLKKIAQTLDFVFPMFQKEFEAYKKQNKNSFYFGHPLLDIVKTSLSTEEREVRFRKGAKKVLLLAPGSRRQEIKNVFPILLDTAKILKEKSAGLKINILISSSWIKEEIEEIAKKSGLDMEFFQEDKYDCIAASDLLIAASGTINLEASILGTNNIMVYKLNPITYWIGKNILKIDKKLKYFSMPNILLDEKFIPEFVQEKANPNLIAEEAYKLLASPPLKKEKLLNILGAPPVISKIAKEISFRL